jgi:hypothetical protein
VLEVLLLVECIILLPLLMLAFCPLRPRAALSAMLIILPLLILLLIQFSPLLIILLLILLLIPPGNGSSLPALPLRQGAGALPLLPMRGPERLG